MATKISSVSWRRPAHALRVVLMMLARSGRLEIGDLLKVQAPN
jgi:hypothetical protein